MSDTETETPCPDGDVTFAARDGRLVLTFREAPSAPAITVTCGYADCEMVLEACRRARLMQRFKRVLSRDAVTAEDRRLYFATVGAEPTKVTWEVAMPFGIAGYRWDMSGVEIENLAAAAREAIRQEDARP